MWESPRNAIPTESNTLDQFCYDMGCFIEQVLEAPGNNIPENDNILDGSVKTGVNYLTAEWNMDRNVYNPNSNYFDNFFYNIPDQIGGAYKVLEKSMAIHSHGLSSIAPTPLIMWTGSSLLFMTCLFFFWDIFGFLFNHVYEGIILHPDLFIPAGQEGLIVLEQAEEYLYMGGHSFSSFHLLKFYQFFGSFLD